MLLQIPGILDASELESLRRSLAGARFDDGSATAGPGARDVKRNLQLLPDSGAAQSCAPIVLQALRRNPIFFSATLPNRVHGPLFNRYDAGMTYGEHVDNAVMGASPGVRSDIAATLFLSAPEEYDGGELTVNDNYGAHRVKLPAGAIVVYPAGCIHRVEPVTRGSRVAAILWIQSLVRDEACRRLLFEMDIALGALRQKGEAPSELDALTSVYHNLLRMWAET